jgi:hypothetical protein
VTDERITPYTGVSKDILMTSASSHSDKILFNEALRIAVGDLAHLDDNLKGKLVKDCLLDDLSDFNVYDDSVIAFMSMIECEMSPNLTIGRLRGTAKVAFSGGTAWRVAREWHGKNDDGGFVEASAFCDRGIQVTHLNHLLRCIGGQSLNESYEIAKKSSPKYPKDSEYEDTRYSLGVEFTAINWGVPFTETIYSENYCHNIYQLLNEARVVLEDELQELVDIKMDNENYSSVESKNIIVYVNDIEALAIPKELDVVHIYHTELDLLSILDQAKAVPGNDKFKHMLVAGKIFGGDEHREFRNRLKGNLVEGELGL